MKSKIKHTLPTHEKRIIQDKIGAFIQSNVHEIIFAYLLGSFAGIEPFSDIDIGVYTEPVVSDLLDFEIDLEKRIEDIVKYPVDVRVLNRSPLAFCQNVIKSGKVIVDRNSNMRADFESITLKKYFDFKHFQERYLGEVINAPV